LQGIIIKMRKNVLKVKVARQIKKPGLTAAHKFVLQLYTKGKKYE
jgi:hypothetical protein